MLSYPKIERRIEAGRGRAFVRLLAEEAVVAADPPQTGSAVPAKVPDPDDEYVIRLAVSQGAIIVSGDRHLTLLAPEFPVYTPTSFVTLLEDHATSPGS